MRANQEDGVVIGEGRLSRELFRDDNDRDVCHVSRVLVYKI